MRTWTSTSGSRKKHSYARARVHRRDVCTLSAVVHVVRVMIDRDFAFVHDELERFSLWRFDSAFDVQETVGAEIGDPCSVGRGNGDRRECVVIRKRRENRVDLEPAVTDAGRHGG